jgi:uncharacterized protein (DUF608 family)
VSLGGRGQLRDWEIFNRPDKGNRPPYCFAAIRAGNVARILEARYLPPYEGSSGLGSDNAPGLPRFAKATFTGEFPTARVDFTDAKVPVKASLEAFSPFFPLDAEEAGLPAAILRYRIRNTGAAAQKVSIAFCLDNPVGLQGPRANFEKRVNEFRDGSGLRGFFMTNPGLEKTDVLWGSLALGLVEAGEVTRLGGWPQRRWWDSPMLFWDDFTSDGALGPEAAKPNKVASVCLEQEIAAGGEKTWTFILAWHFPNRTPERCGWTAPKGHEKDVIGNHYCVRFPDAWAAAEYAARNLDKLEKQTRAFTSAIRESSLPAAVKDAAMSNLSTLATTTCFRTADGEFHGFEGVNDKSGCCYGNCTHVWNYETSTPFLFPSLSRSLRKAAFGYSLDDQGAIHFRQKLPDGFDRSGFAAADGQMGQIMKVYLDWSLSGDLAWLKAIWPRVKKAIEFAWVPGGWDADKDGIMEGVQHNTYDVEFYGPNPQCGVFYLGALRACEEMARAVGDPAADEYRAVFEKGSHWMDANLFNGEFYIQKIRPVKKDQVTKVVMGDMGGADTEHPEYQMGEGCLADQLIGQYLADVCGLGALVKPENFKTATVSVYRYNYKRDLSEHANVQRTFALNDESALLVCDYKPGRRPQIPFPYYAELFTGIEYLAAAQMMYAGMTREGTEVTEAVRRRYDGERRNPWDEAECGHHYARAMAAWSTVLALCGWRYFAPEQRVEIRPRSRAQVFRGFWSSGAGWGTFEKTAAGVTIKVEQGELPVASVWIEKQGRLVKAGPAKELLLKAGESLRV